MPEIITKKGKIELLRERVKVLKPDLQQIKHWKVEFLKSNPDYNEKYWIDLLTRMMAGRTVDEQLITALENFYEANKPQK